MNYPKASDLERDLTSQLKYTAAGNARAMAATVVAVGEAAGAAELDALVDALMGRRPARVLHLRSRAAQAGSWSSARCALDRQSRGVCFEDVYIETTDNSALDGRVWGPLVIREMPALLIWNLGPGLLAGCGYDCAERVDLTILDGSRDLRALDVDLDRYRSQMQGAVAGVSALVDLAWERLLPLRFALSRLFDGPGAPDPRGIEELDIRGLDPWSAGLLSGWMRDRLRSAKAHFSVKVGIDGAGGLPEAAVRLHGGRRGAVRFLTARQCRLDFFDGRTLDMSFPDPGPAAVLARLVDAPVADALYKGALDLSRRDTEPTSSP